VCGKAKRSYGRGGSTAKQVSPRPGSIPARGLHAGNGGDFIVSRSLRAEIAAAQNGDTIVFSPQLDGKTITLTTGELDVTKNLTIQGPGAGQLTISGNSVNWYTDIGAIRNTYASRVFEVAQNATVTLSGLTISNGNGVASGSSVAPWDGYGGGILNHGTLSVSGCTVYSNSAHEGGGIFSDGTLVVSGCTVSGNAAYQGAGIANWGTATFISSAVSNNYAGDGLGGGIFNHGTLTLSGCTVSGNRSEEVIGCSSVVELEGGGIFNDGTLTVEQSSSITGNGASGLGADGYNRGVLYLDASSIIGILDGNPATPI
jgi:hypothetical protein